MATFPERLRELRTQRGFSQQDLADRTDQTKQAISQYERGVRRPDVSSYYSQTYRRFNTVKRRIAPESAV